MLGYQLGIDLGTTYTAAAVCRSTACEQAEPEIVNLGTRGATVPSVLFVAPDGSVVVGEAAARRALTDPDRVVREFKRRIGDPTPVIVGGRAFAPEELAAHLVRWVVERVAEREGGAPTRIALTHPASWGQHKRELLAAALGVEGLTVTFLAEPQAAALHYATAERVPAGSTIAVYDLGGGTFDAAVVRKADPSASPSGPAVVGPTRTDTAVFGLLGRPEGLDRLGGIDFDEVVFEHVREGLPEAFADLDEADQGVLSAVARVRRDCVEAKEALSSDTEVSVPVLMPAARGSVRLHRSEFEALIRPQIEQTVGALRAAVRSAGCTPDELTAILLVGGSSRIPLVAQLVSEGLDRPVAVDADPKNAIAKGAALAVSPRPTASWPDVSVPKVPALVGGAFVSASGESDHTGWAGTGPGSGAGTATRSRLAPPRRGPFDTVETPPVGSVAEAPARPPAPARQTPDPDWEYEAAVVPRRQPGAVLVGLVGLTVGAVVVAVLLLTHRSPAVGIGVDSGSGPVATSAPAEPTTSSPAPAPVEVGPTVARPGPGEPARSGVASRSVRATHAGIATHPTAAAAGGTPPTATGPAVGGAGTGGGGDQAGGGTAGSGTGGAAGSGTGGAAGNGAGGAAGNGAGGPPTGGTGTTDTASAAAAPTSSAAGGARGAEGLAADPTASSGPVSSAALPG